MVAAAVAGRSRPLVIVDIAVPRNVEPAAGRVPGVHLCDIDDLMDLPGGVGRDGVRRAEALVEEDVQAFLRARAARGTAAAIAAARADAEAILAHEWECARARLASLSPEETQAVRTVLQRVVNKLLHRPITALTEAARYRHLAGDAVAADAGGGFGGCRGEPRTKQQVGVHRRKGVHGAKQENSVTGCASPVFEAPSWG